MNKINCIFCKISQNEIASSKIFENEHFFVIPDLHPQASIHLLVISKEHCANFTDLPPIILPKLQDVIISVVTNNKLSESGYRLIINSGQDGGQEIPHFHMHILAGEKIGPMRTAPNKGGDF